VYDPRFQACFEDILEQSILWGPFLMFGNYTAIFNWIREMAMEDGTPLYKQDVDKLNQQDDNAASHLFSSHVLQ
jgi:hypothetical protein